MNAKTFRILQSLALLGLAGFLLEKILSGQLSWYIHQRFMPLTLAGAAGLALMALAALVYTRRQVPERPPAEELTHPPQEAEDHGHNHGHDYGHDYGHDHAHGQAIDRASWINLALLALPLLIGLLPAQPLSVEAISSKGISANTPLSLASGGPTAIKSDPQQRTILDWIKIFNYEADLSAYTGQAADVTGFVYHDPRLPEGHFLVSRFAIVCCAADAFAIGMVVRWPEATALETDTWVNVRGAVEIFSLEGHNLPLVQAVSVAPASQPSDPYLFP